MEGKDNEYLVGFDQFKSEFPHGNGFISLGYLEDLCKFIYEHPDLTDEDKLERILILEGIIEHRITEMKAKYVPTWSPKLKKRTVI